MTIDQVAMNASEIFLTMQLEFRRYLVGNTYPGVRSAEGVSWRTCTGVDRNVTRWRVASERNEESVDSNLRYPAPRRTYSHVHSYSLTITLAVVARTGTRGFPRDTSHVQRIAIMLFANSVRDVQVPSVLRRIFFDKIPLEHVARKFPLCWLAVVCNRLWFVRWSVKKGDLFTLFWKNCGGLKFRSLEFFLAGLLDSSVFLKVNYNSLL